MLLREDGTKSLPKKKKQKNVVDGMGRNEDAVIENARGPLAGDGDGAGATHGYCRHWILQFRLNRIDFSSLLAKNRQRARERHNFVHILLEFSCHQLPAKVFERGIFFFFLVLPLFFIFFAFVVRQLSKKFRHVCAAANKMSLFFA